MCQTLIDLSVAVLQCHCISCSQSRERIARLQKDHRPMEPQYSRSPLPALGRPGPRGGHVSVHSRLGAMPRNAEVMQREMAERDMFIRDRERQVKRVCFYVNIRF